MTMDDGGYDPADLTIASAGKTFGITLTNNGKFVHNLHIAGPDGQFDTDDDIVSGDIAPCTPTDTPTPTPTPSATPTPTAEPDTSDTSSPTVTAAPTPTPAPTCGVGQVTGKIDTAGTYKYRDDFHKTEITGNIVIE